MTLELALTVGKAVAEKAGYRWLAGKKAEAERDKNLIELIQIRFPDQIARRRVELQLEDIAVSVAQRLRPLLAHEYRDLTTNDRAAVLAEVVQTLDAADLSDQALFRADADPLKLSRSIRAALPRRGTTLDLGEAGARLYEVVLDECCDCLVRIIRQLPQFGARASAELLSRLSGLADQVAAVLARLPARSLAAPDGTADDSEFNRRYLEYISETLDILELIGLRVERYRPRTTLSVAYISLSVSTEGDTSTRRVQHSLLPGQDHLWNAGWREEKGLEEGATLRVESALSGSMMTLIRGEAGSGKSTLLRWLAIAAARGAFTSGLSGWNGCVPFLIKLRSHVEGELPRPEQFLDDIAGPLSGLMPTGWVHRQLLAGHGLLLVDGVDELPGGRRRAVRQWLAGLIKAYPNMRVVVTSRPAAAGSDWLAAEGFAAAILERMSPSDLRALIRHWHDAVRTSGDLPCSPERLPGYEAALLARLQAAPHLRMLAASPLLAAMLCALNLDRDTQLPRDRMGLYSAALEMLLERRDAERQIPSYHEITLERDQKLRILQDLAWRLSITGRAELPTVTVQRRIEEKLTNMPRISASPQEVLDHLLQRSGILREPVPGRIDFVHRTVQEYLTAKQAADDGDMEPLIANAHKDQWHETVVMAAGHANAPLRRQLLVGLLHRIRTEPRRARQMKLLVASCLETLPDVPADFAADTRACLEDQIPPQDITAARSLAGVGEPVLERLPQTLNGLSTTVSRATVRVAWLINGPKALTVLGRYADDARIPVQTELIEGWRYFDSDEYAERVLADAPLGAGGSVNVKSLSQLQGLRHLHHLRQLTIQLAVPDLTFLTGLPPLNSLTIMAGIESGNLAPLAAHADTLRMLSIMPHKAIQDVGPLANLQKLEMLTLRPVGLTDLNFVGNLPQLKRLNLYDLENITDFNPVNCQVALEELCLWECRHLSDIDELPPLGKLKALALTGSELECGLDYLVAACPQVQDLYLYNCQWVNDLTPVSMRSLRSLGLWGCKDVDDLSALAGLAQLAYLDLEGTAINDITPLLGLTKLQTLWLKDCSQIRDLSPLAEIRSLRTLHIEGIAPDIDLGSLVQNRQLDIIMYDGQTVRNLDSFSKRRIRSVPRQEALL